MPRGPIGRAARSGDYAEVLRQTLVKVADTLDETDSGRDVSALAIKVADLVDRMEARDGAPGKKPATTEVSAFEVIANRRAEPRAAAEG